MAQESPSEDTCARRHTPDDECRYRLVAVVVTYNRLDKLKTGLAATLEQRCDAVIVVDNCSTDGTREWLQEQAKRHEHLDVILASKNLGGAGGFEQGFRHAQEHYHPDWLVCFDDDAWPAPAAFDTFLKSDLDGIDAAAAAVYFPNGEICEMNSPTLNPFWHWRVFLKTFAGQGRKRFHLDDKDYESQTPIAIDSASFVGFFVRGTTVERVGLPEGRLFIYCDDLLYTLEITRRGGYFAFLPWVAFTHDCTASSPVQQKAFKPLWKVFYAYRNRARVLRVKAGWFAWFLLPLEVTKWLLHARFYGNRRPYLRLTFAAIWDAARGRYDRPHEHVLELASGD